MNVLVIGGGGREHALADSLARSQRVSRVYCAPGNAGTAGIAENVALSAGNLEALVALAKEKQIALTVVGPEGPLCDGIVDQFEREGLKIFGPTKRAARIEGDKAYAKKLMKLAHVPTAEARVFEHYDQARDYVATRDSGVVVKAVGLAAGKGVFVCSDPAEALLALEQIMVDRQFGDAGDCVIVEEVLKGPELSVHALVNDRTIYMLESAQDHKPIGEGDTGPNTGGMGTYSPAPIATEHVLATIERDILVPIVDAMRQDDAPYRGVLYAGLMLTPAGPKVLEFNCRFGDPETQVLLARLKSDLFDLLEATVDGRLASADVRWDPKPAVCVVMASGGYPGEYEKGKPITGLDGISTRSDIRVYHAGTRKAGSDILTSGGRVLGVTGLGADIAAAKARAYLGVSMISFEGSYVRGDIADKAIHTTL